MKLLGIWYCDFCGNEAQYRGPVDNVMKEMCKEHWGEVVVKMACKKKGKKK